MAAIASSSDDVVLPSTVKTGAACGLSMRHSCAISAQLVCLLKAYLIAFSFFFLLSALTKFLISVVILNLCLPSGLLANLILSPYQLLDPGSCDDVPLGAALGIALAMSANILSRSAKLVGGVALIAASARAPKSPGLSSSLFPWGGPYFRTVGVGVMGQRESYRSVVTLHVPVRTSVLGLVVPL